MTEDRPGRILVIVLANSMENRQRGAIQLFPDPPCDFIDAASAAGRQQPRPAKNPQPFHVTHRREISRDIQLFAMRAQEAIDTAQQKTHAALSICEHKPPCRQPTAAPTLNRLAGDVEFFRHIVNRQHRFGHQPGLHSQRVAHLLDQQSQIVLQCQPRQQIFIDVPGVVSGDLENNEVERIGPGRVDQMKKLLCGSDLCRAIVDRRERQLARKVCDRVDAELRHDSKG